VYLLDTNIISADAPTKRRVGVEAFAAWMRAHSDQLYLSTITIAEIEAGIARAVRLAATTKAEKLRRWLAAVEHFYAERILPFVIEEARHAGLILDHARP
jgi:toxin FitB